ncbi:histidine phosphatase family protein [Cedecea colo]|uniref:Histidine phosphatase family protein n=1 Tax=Cedecea colo TaxID=2552946 RepID=A0ABX0VP76_9ENTR|nr:histidine phosphatase family protein [Cedecea colo]NIY48819.1 histidine phosphatase family protein [Cedecea colo]
MKKIYSWLAGLCLVLSVTQSFAADVTIYLTRHGKTMFNTVHRAQGWADTPLTAPGIEVARHLGKGLKDVKFYSVYSSDAGRARETARLIMDAKATPFTLNERPELREVCFGIFEGDLDPNMWGAAAKQAGFKSEAAMMKSFAARKISIADMIDAIAGADSSGGAEKYSTVAERMEQGILNIARHAHGNEARNVLVVSHGTAIMALLNKLGYQELTGPLENASVTKIRFTDEGKLVIDSVGDMSYVAQGKAWLKP